MPAKTPAKKSQKKTTLAASKATQKKTAKKQSSVQKKSATKAKATSVKKSTAKTSKPKASTAKKQAAKSTSKKTSAASKSVKAKPSTTKKKSTVKKKPSTAAQTKATATKKKSVNKNVTAKPITKKSTQKSTSKKSTAKQPATTKKGSSKRIVPTAPRVKMPEFPTTKWGNNLVIHFEIAEQLPPPHLTSIAGGIVFHEDKVLLANVPGRGWEIIGGRIDLDEDPEITFRRETQKQLGITMSHAKMLGLMRIEHIGPMPPNCPYPYPVAYGVQYIGILDEMLPFEGSVDSLGRSLITMDGLPEHYYGWNDYQEAVFKYAFDEYQKWRKKLKL